MTVRILIVDDHEVMREGLHALLFREADFDVVSSVGDGFSAIEEAKRTIPDIVIMDVNMPGKNGIETTRELKEILPQVKVLCLSMHNNSTCVRSALSAGASGYLLKDCDLSEITEGIRAVMNGENYLSKNLKNSSNIKALNRKHK